MAKKSKLEEVVSVNNIDYISIIDEFNDKAFRFCVDQLYPLCDYHVLKKSDIRKVDMKELFFSLPKLIPKNDKGKEQGSLDYYLFVLKQYFDGFFKYGPDSKAEHYRNRAVELIGNVLSREGTIEDIQDVVIIFISLFRAYRDGLSESGVDIKEYVLSELKLDLLLEDSALLKVVADNHRLVPGNTIRRLEIVDKLIGSDSAQKAATRFLYFTNTIFLCRGLQMFGVL